MKLPRTINISWRELFRDRDIVIGDTFIVPADRARSCQSRLNQLGFGAKREASTEPGCAVTAAAERGLINARRLASYRRLASEIAQPKPSPLLEAHTTAQRPESPRSMPLPPEKQPMSGRASGAQPCCAARALRVAILARRAPSSDPPARYA